MGLRACRGAGRWPTLSPAFRIAKTCPPVRKHVTLGRSMCNLALIRFAMMTSASTTKVVQALEGLRIELPSWGFANTGTRFGKYWQAAAASTTEEKFSDAAQVHAVTGICPTIALHVLWDCAKGVDSTHEIQTFSTRYGIQPGAINPNLFQEQIYKYGSF